MTTSPIHMPPSTGDIPSLLASEHIAMAANPIHMVFQHVTRLQHYPCGITTYYNDIQTTSVLHVDYKYVQLAYVHVHMTHMYPVY